jgi:hypothetical protein
VIRRKLCILIYRPHKKISCVRKKIGRVFRPTQIITTGILTRNVANCVKGLLRFYGLLNKELHGAISDMGMRVVVFLGATPTQKTKIGK